MELYIHCVTADKIMKCKRSSEEVLKHITLVNPQCYENQIFFDVHVTLPEDYNICSRFEGKDEIMVISLSKLGVIELNVMDFRSITIC